MVVQPEGMWTRQTMTCCDGVVTPCHGHTRSQDERKDTKIQWVVVYDLQDPRMKHWIR